MEIYDNINEECNDFKNDIFFSNINNFEINIGQFDKSKIPYSRNRTNVNDLFKGRVTSDDIYKKYSQKVNKYQKKKLFE